MNYSFNKKSSLSRLMSLALVAALVLTMLGGCSLIPSKEPSTEPSTEDTTPNMPNLVDEIETTEAPTSETTEPPTVAKKENVAVVKEQLSIRSSPSTGSRVITQLDAGDEVEVLRIEPIGTVQWAYVSSDTLNVMGWIVTDMLDMSNVQLAAGGTSTPANGETTPVNTTAPTTAPVDSLTGTGSSTTTPANSQVGVVNTNTLNIRSSASTNGERLGQYTFGDRITILETSNGWGRTDKGWVSLNYVNMNGTTTGGNTTGGNTTGGNTGTGNTGNATVTGNGLNVRSGAGTEYDIVTSLQQGAVINITETTTVGTTQWGKISQGWVCMDYVRMSGSVGTPSGTTGATGNATVTGSGLNIRSGAGTNYAVVGTLAQGETVNVLESVNVGGSQWGRISQGWICLDYVRIN